MLAQLATEAGYAVVAVDRFGDLDLLGLHRCRVLRDARGGGMAALVGVAERVAADAVIYGGGLENRPDLVARLARGRRLLGNTPEVLARVRDPAILAAALRSDGLAYPLTLAPARAVRDADRSRAWLRKPLRSGGGRGIRTWRGGALGPGEVVQERICGLACSVAGVGDGRGAAVLGLTEQLVGQPAFGARGYGWCGNVVPPRMATEERVVVWREAERICSRLVEAFRLRGVFGVDLVWDGRRAWVIEVNPRPPGSLEAIELAGATGTLNAHVRAFDGELPRPRGDTVGGAGPAAAKAILYAASDIVVSDTREWHRQGIRDIPRPRQRIAAGAPVCTLVAVSTTPQEAVDALRERAARLQAMLSPASESHAIA
jgi:predicted ATP-grasp superfamily ATP-dependent carboligase